MPIDSDTSDLDADLEAELGLEVDTPHDPDADARDLYELVRDKRSPRPTWAQLSEWKRADFRSAAKWRDDLVVIPAQHIRGPELPIVIPQMTESHWAANRRYEIKVRKAKHEPLMVEAYVNWSDAAPATYTERVATSFCLSIGQCPGCFAAAIDEQNALQSPDLAALNEECHTGIFHDSAASAERTHIRLLAIEGTLHAAAGALGNVGRNGRRLDKPDYEP